MLPAQPPTKEGTNINPSPAANIKPITAKKRGTRKLRILGEPQANAASEYELNKCDNPANNEDVSGPCNKLLLEKEQNERAALAASQETPIPYSYLYPSLNDNSFNEKITSKQEFNDTKYEGIKTEEGEDGKPVAMDVETYSTILSNAPFELQPHQAFVKNFLSLQTPYNSLLLYHGLGSGKTCSAIGVCEEQRDYLKQMGINKKIIIIAAPNVQDNFRLQLFDERKLVETDGLWNIRACTGNKMLKEINPTTLRMLTKEMIVKQINHLINTYYSFVGYIQFANMVDDIIAKVNSALGDSADLTEETRQKYINAQLNSEFNNSLIVIDEVHNIRIADENPRKSAAVNLMKLAHSVENLRFLLLSATPMYNNYAEIVWLLNLMNVNDKRAAVEIKQIFAPDGQFLVDPSKPDGEQNVGERLFVQKCTGYVSFVRGENPYTFPFRIYPELFAPPANTFISASALAEGLKEADELRHPEYPAYQMNNKPIDKETPPIIPMFLTNIGETQMYGYKCIINYLKREQLQLTNDALKFENMETFGYTILQKPIEALNMVYPVDGLKEYAKELEVAAAAAKEVPVIDAPVNPEQLEKYKTSPLVRELEKEQKEEQVREGLDLEEGEEEGPTSQAGGEPVIRGILSNITGKSGLKYAMQFEGAGDTAIKGNFEYRPRILKKYGRIFSPDNIRYYSAKIAQICASIRTPNRDGVGFRVSKGIILIYSQYIDSGLIPVALALEELGFTRYGKDSKSLFKTAPPNTPVDVVTMMPRQGKAKAPFMPARYTMITGDKRLSKNNDADIKAITNENNKDGNIIKVVLISTAGSEGIDLKFIRQVHILDPWYNMNRIEQIIGRAVRNFSHKDLPFNERNVEIFLHGTMLLGQDQVQEEAADLYVYRVAEMKAIQIGKISRLLKETAVDCVLNYEQTTLTRAHFEEMGQKPVQQLLSYYTTDDESIQYKVGDVPFSATCDYGQCEYKCLNLNEAGLLEETPTPSSAAISRDTYNEKFIMSNAEKIVQKIKDIFSNKENGHHYFYKKERLRKLVNTPRVFPDLQIYAAISQLIYDKSEHITDFYNRPGHLVNIGDYYLFQPAEFGSNNTSAISSFDRSVPVDYKHISININTEGREPQGAVKYAKDVHSFGSKFAEKEERGLEDEGLAAAAADISPIKTDDHIVLDKIKQQYHIAMQSMQEYAELEQNAPTPDELEEYSGYMKDQNLFRQGKSKENLSPLENLKLKILSTKINAFKKGIKQIVEPDEFTENDFVDLASFQHKKEENKLTKNEKKQYAELEKKHERALHLRLTMDDKEHNDNWFNYCGIALHKLQQIPFVAGVKPNKEALKKLDRYLIEHAVDVLLYSEKIRLLNALQSISPEDRDPLEEDAYNYMTRPKNKPEKVVKVGRREFLILYDGKTQIEKNYDDDKRRLLALNKNRWELANASANKDFNEEVERLKEDFKRENLNNRINNIIGFIGYEKQGKQLLFKTKDITSDRNLVGARCDQTGKTELLKMLNSLVGSRVFTEITTKLSGQQELCTTMELLFRYSNDIEVQGKLWFFSPEQTELYYLEHCKIKNKKFICQQP